MLSALIATALLSPVYSFSPSEKLVYDVVVGFDGFIPVMGGQVGNVKVSIGLDVKGVKPEGEAPAASQSELSAFKLEFNGAELPFTLDNVKGYFPKNTIQISAQGRVLKTDAPDVQLPVRLPGLDARRFPDITYLPIEFPEAGVEIGKPFTFTKSFGGSPVTYTVTPVEQKGDLLELKVEMKQEYEVWEDEGVNVVTDEKDAFARTKTTLAGGGKVFFDLAKGRLDRMSIAAEALSTSTEIKSKKTSERKLKTSLEVKLKSPKRTGTSG